MQLQVSTADGISREVIAQPGDTLSRAIYLSGFFAPRPLCSALGNCGLCRVRFISKAPDHSLEDEHILGQEAVAQGWRLGCRHKAGPGDHVFIPEPQAGQSAAQPQAMPGAAPGADPGVTPKALLLAVDLGTTSLAWSALAVEDGAGDAGRIVRQGRILNPQIGAGSDVLSRLSAAMAPGGGKRLKDITLEALQRIIAELPAPVSRVCLAGNTAMTALARGASVLGLASAPYALEFHGNSEESLPGLPPVYFPPQVSTYIGADISAGMAFILAQKPAFPFLLADMGTNGEFVLALSAKKSLAVSIPLGPALEGIGLSCGALAGVGGGARVITEFELTPKGLQPRIAEETEAVGGAGAAPVEPGDGVAQYPGISGTGYLSLVHILYKLNIIGEDGRFNAEAAAQAGLTPLARGLAKQLRARNGQTELALPGKLSLTGTDLEELLKVKAAFSLAVDSLLKAAELKAASLRNCYLAGALGKHVRAADLLGLGFLPGALKPEKIKAVGNAALYGAQLLLRSAGHREAATQWAAGVKTLNLTADKTFMRLYLNHMRFCFPPSDHD